MCMKGGLYRPLNRGNARISDFVSGSFFYLACFPRTQVKSLVPFLQGRHYFVVTI